MKDTADRRQRMLEYLVECKNSTRLEMARLFQVSVRTVERDILVLSCYYPIITVRGGGGGIRVMENFRLGMKYMTADQKELLEKLSELLCGEELVIMQAIIKTFSRPVMVK